MNSTVLSDIKRSLGPMIGNEFDTQIIGLIDIALLSLAQVGCLKPLNSSLTDSTTWADIVNPPFVKDRPESANALPAIKSYIYIKVKLMFDPPVSGVVSIYEEEANQLLWRIGVAYDTKE